MGNYDDNTYMYCERNWGGGGGEFLDIIASYRRILSSVHCLLLSNLHRLR